MWTMKSVYIVSHKNDSIFTCAHRIYKTNGIMGFQRGLIMGYANSLNGIITFTLYDILKDISNVYLIDYCENTKIFTCSTISKSVACFMTFPIFACRIHHQINQTKTILHTFRYVCSNPLKMYSGLLPTLIQTIPKSSITFLLNEIFLSMFFNKN